jgi:hypothetical protein
LSEPKTEEYSEIEINFRETVQPGQGLRVTKSYREGGKITQVMFHFPSGCNALVRMRLQKDGHPFYPVKGHLALNDATPVYYVQADYYPNEPLELEVLNQDSVNPHTVTCTVVIRYKKPSWYP